MKRFKNILYVFHINQDNEVGLKRAAITAALNNAKLTIMVAKEKSNTSNVNLDKLSNTIINYVNDDICRREGYPEALINNHNIIFTHGIPRIDVIEIVCKHHFDLVITEPDSVSGLKKFFYGTTTLSLIRKCPCPVWVVKPEIKTPYRKIMAAIDPSSNNTHTDELCQTILEISTSMSERNKAECHIVHAWHNESEVGLGNPFFGQTTRDEIQHEIFVDESQHKKHFEEMLEKHLIASDQAIPHLLSGEIRQTLTNFAHDNDIDLIILGSHEKDHANGILLGSTAETLIDQAECSILVIKPSNFQCPVKF